MNEIRDYDAYFTFPSIGDDGLKEIQSYFNEYNFEIDLSSTAIEFESTGRDEDRLVLKLFKKIAKLLENAEGELRCVIDDDEHKDPNFEFFTINNRQLIVQKGHLVREEKKLPV